MQASIQEILAFAGVVTLLVMFPGPNTLLVMRNAGQGGTRAGCLTVAGVVVALYVHALLSVLGLSVIITRSAHAYLVLKMLGATYIMYLGAAGLYGVFAGRSRKAVGADGEADADSRLTVRAVAFFTQGFVSNVLNPKVALFFLALFPQFIHAEGNVVGEAFLLTLVYSLISMTWYMLLVLFVNRFRQSLQNSTIRQGLAVVAGIVLLGLGLRMILLA